MLAFLFLLVCCFIYFVAKALTKGEATEIKDLMIDVSSLAEGETMNIPIENAPQGQQTINVKIKDNSVDANRIIEYTGELPRKFEFRPENFSQFIGQEEAKDRAKTIIKKAKMNLKSHFLVDGIRGHGKTTFVHLIQKELGGKIIEYIGRQINEDNIVDIINEINTSQERFVVLFVDEFDSMESKVVKILNPIIETFELSGKKIKPFIFAGATINKHELIRNNPDTLDRIPFQVKFKKYNAEELITILKQYHAQLYADIEVSDTIFYTIATSCKFNPRTAIGLLEEYIVEKNIEKVLKNNNIVLNGLTKIDIKILDVLANVKRMGANALAMRVGLSEREYITEFEPFLVEYGYINRIPNRVIAEKGQDILKQLKETAYEKE